MKNPLNWNDRPDLFGLVVDALENAVYGKDAELRNDISEISGIWASEEEGSYGEKGVVDINMKDGRKFRLELTEID